MAESRMRKMNPEEQQTLKDFVASHPNISGAAVMRDTLEEEEPEFFAKLYQEYGKSRIYEKLYSLLPTQPRKRKRKRVTEETEDQMSKRARPSDFPSHWAPQGVNSILVSVNGEELDKVKSRFLETMPSVSGCWLLLTFRSDNLGGAESSEPALVERLFPFQKANDPKIW